MERDSQFLQLNIYDAEPTKTLKYNSSLSWYDSAQYKKIFY